MKSQHIKTKREKEVWRLVKQQHQLWEERMALGFQKLEKPIRHGWFKEIKITYKVDRYKNKKAILEVFDAIEKTYWGKTKTDADKKWFEQVSEYLIFKDFPTLSKKQYSRLSDKAKALCTPYRFKNKVKKWKTRFYIRIPKSAYTIKYTRAYITHRRRIDPTLESQIEEIEQQLVSKEYIKTYRKLIGYHRFNKWCGDDYRYKRKKQKHQLQKNIKNGTLTQHIFI